MKTNFKISSKMHLFIIISCLIMVIAAAIGTACHFTAFGFFNYGDDWASYRSVQVSYAYVDFGDKQDLEEICNEAFKSAGISSYDHVYSERSAGTSAGGDLIYKFTLSTDETKIENAVLLIQGKIDAVANKDVTLSTVSTGVTEGLNGSLKALSMGAIAISVVIVFHFIYFAIRYRLSMAFAALLADIHNLLLFISLLIITRIPVGTAMFVFAALTVVATVICTSLAFGKLRVNVKDEELSKLPAFELIDKTANENMFSNLLVPAGMSAFALLLFVLTAISSLSALAVLSPVMCALVGFVACAYGSALFVPSVYSRFYVIAENAKAKRAQAKKEKAKAKASK